MWSRTCINAHTHAWMQAHIIVEASQHARALICSAAFKTTAAIHFRKLKPQSDFNQRHQSTNCSSRYPFLSLSVMAKSVLTCPLLQCLSFFFLSFSLQIHIDIPRTNPLIPLFQQASVQEVRPLQLHTHHLT